MPTRLLGGLAVGRTTDDPTALQAAQRIWIQQESVNWGSVAAGADADATVTVTGVLSANTNLVFAQINGDINDGLVLESAAVTADDTVTLRLLNTTGGALDPAAVNVSVLVIEL